MSDYPDAAKPETALFGDQREAAVARSYFYLFFIFCAVIAFLEKRDLGLGFVVVLVTGTFAVPLLIAVPLIYLKKVLGTKGLLRPQNGQGKVHYRLIDLTGVVVLWYATWGAISVLSG